MLTATLTSPEATGTFARLLAVRLAPPALVTLRGELGTGKTTLVREALRALGVEGVVASPSFTLAQSYEGADGLRLHHLDLYRLGPGADAALFALDDYLDDAALTFVEWPEAGAAELPPADVDVLLSTARWKAAGSRCAPRPPSKRRWPPRWRPPASAATGVGRWRGRPEESRMILALETSSARRLGRRRRRGGRVARRVAAGRGRPPGAAPARVRPRGA